MKDRILATAELHVVYSRPEGATDQGGQERGDRPPRDPQNDTRPPPPRDETGRDNPPPPRDAQAPVEPPAQGKQRPQEGAQGGGQGARQGGGKQMPENKLPVSPNQGQTVGLYLNTPKACPGYTLISMPAHQQAHERDAQKDAQENFPESCEIVLAWGTRMPYVFTVFIADVRRSH